MTAGPDDDTSFTFPVSDGDVSFVLNLPDWETDYIQGYLARTSSPYESEMLRDMARRLQPGDNVVDVGANIGNHTFYLASLRCNVDAFEPDVSLTDAMTKSAVSNGFGDRVIIHPVALGDTPAVGSLVRDDQRNIGRQRVVAAEGDRERISISPLDSIDVRRPVRAMKIDVEGMEGQVISGARQILVEDRPLMYVEAASRDALSAIARALSVLGYTCWDVFNSTPTYLFVHRDEVDDRDVAAQTLLKASMEMHDLVDQLRSTRSRLDEVNLKYRDLSLSFARLREGGDRAVVIPVSPGRLTDEQVRLRRESVSRRRQEQRLARAVQLREDEVREALSRVASLETTVRDLRRRVTRGEQRLDEARREVNTALGLSREADRDRVAARRDAETADLRAVEVEDRLRILADAYRETRSRNRDVDSRLTDAVARAQDDAARLRQGADAAAQQTAELVTRLRRDLDDAARRRSEMADQLRSETLRATEAAERLELELETSRALRSEVASLRSSVTYTVGKAIRAAQRSPLKMVRLPLILRQEARRARDEHVERLRAEDTTADAVPVDGTSSTPGPEGSRWMVDPRTSMLRLAVVVDDFTGHALEPEAQITHLVPASWKAQLESAVPDLLFVESAWRGKDGAWHNAVSHMGPELRGIVDWCRSRSIPTIFWNKEDPVHFATFLNAASWFDVVFTTDIDCVPRYKSALGHDRVHLLPFAAQPLHHHPVGTDRRASSIAFAGAYYQKYPERTRDLDSFLANLPQFKPVEIYDRNLHGQDPAYKFPAAYAKYIVGTLRPEQIDVAYRGYDYAINLNSVKQSQTMFARRVFELLASGTTVISNFSRGVRILFGDLVTSTDDGHDAVRRLSVLERDPARRDSLRLAGLRKVLSEHTYAHRVSLVAEKALGLPEIEAVPAVTFVGAASDEHELGLLLSHAARQQPLGLARFLWIAPTRLASLVPPEHEMLSPEAIGSQTVGELVSTQFCGMLVAEDYYGPHYALDLVLGSRFACADVIGKGAFWGRRDDGTTVLHDPEKEYSRVARLGMRRAVVVTSTIASMGCADWLGSGPGAEYDHAEQVSLDRFGYGERMDPEMATGAAVDGHAGDEGVPLARVEKIAERARTSVPDPGADERVELSDLAQLFSGVTRPGVEHVLGRDTWDVVSDLADGVHDYLYARTSIPIETLWTTSSADVHLDSSTGLNIQMVFIFHDSDSQRLDAFFVVPGKNARHPIPEGAVAVKIGIRVMGKGAARISRVLLSHIDTEPAALVSGQENLVISNHYPSYGDLYRNAFVHSRVLSYRDLGVGTEVFRLREGAVLSFDEFQGVDVVTGGASALRLLLDDNEFRSLMVHFLDEVMWDVVRQRQESSRVVVWVHGAEVRPWWRLAHNLGQDGVTDAVREASEKRLAFWRGVFEEAGPQVHFVFVSQIFADEVMSDLGITLDRSRYTVIHNPVDVDFFQTQKKEVEQRLSILSIRPFASRTYANDLAVRAILDLSEETWFDELTFTIVGDGPLFDEIVEPLRRFPNVTLQKRFLTREQILELHRSSGVFLVPTRLDSQGVSRDEAMSSGLVPITCAVSAVPEFVDGSSGILVDQEDWKGLADAIRFLRDSPATFERLSAGAAQRVRLQSPARAVAAAEVGLMRDDHVNSSEDKS